MITIKIVKSSKEYYWYKNHIGEIFDVKLLYRNNDIKYNHRTGEISNVDKTYSNKTNIDKFFVLNDSTKRIDCRDCMILNVSYKIKKIKSRINKQKDFENK